MKTQKGNIAVIALIIVVVAITAGTIGWMFAKKSQVPVAKPVATQLAPITQTQSTIDQQSTAEPNDKMEFIKVYKDEKNGFEIQYPAFFTLAGNPTIDSGNVTLTNLTCQSNDKLCFSDTQSILVYVTDNKENETIDQYYHRLPSNGIGKLQKIELDHIPLTFNEDGTIVPRINAGRYEFDAIPKQEAGGYTYLIFEKGKIFEIVVLSSVNDHLLDNMMRTFTWTK